MQPKPHLVDKPAAYRYKEADVTDLAVQGGSMEVAAPVDRARALSAFRVGDNVFYWLTRLSALGVLVILGGIIVSLDMFDSPDTCRKVWPRILTGLVFDAEEAKPTEMQPDVISALEMFQIGSWESVPAVGIGEEYRVSANDRSFHGSALFFNNHLVHGSMIFSSVPEAMGV